MTSRAPDPLNLEQVADIAALLQADTDLDEVIAKMRNYDWNKIDCIVTLRDHGGVSLHDAKDIVHLSPAWSDRYEADEALHDALEQALARYESGAKLHGDRK